MPSILLYSTALASLSLLTESLLHLYVVYGLIAALGIGAQSVAFIKALCAWFDRRRGLVIGICMAGFGIGYVLVPLITHALIEQFGWRSAYLGLGLLAMLLPLPATALLLRDTPAELGLLADGEPVPEEEKPSAPPQTGQSLSDALRSREMWLLAASFALMSAALNGLQSQFVPLLTGRGFSAAAAATLLAGVGVGSFPGRILIGWLVDKFFAPHIAFVFYAVSAGGIFLIIQGGPFSVMFLCAVIIGLSLGAEKRRARLSHRPLLRASMFRSDLRDAPGVLPDRRRGRPRSRWPTATTSSVRISRSCMRASAWSSCPAYACYCCGAIRCLRGRRGRPECGRQHNTKVTYRPRLIY